MSNCFFYHEIVSFYRDLHLAPIHLVGGAYCTGAAWINGASRDLKTDISVLTTDEAMNALDKLEPAKFRYKSDPVEEHLGFIAEDVPDFVAMEDRKGVSAMDIVALLTKVIQEQQNTLRQQEERIVELESLMIGLSE